MKPTSSYVDPIQAAEAFDAYQDAQFRFSASLLEKARSDPAIEKKLRQICRGNKPLRQALEHALATTDHWMSDKFQSFREGGRQ